MAVNRTSLRVVAPATARVRPATVAATVRVRAAATPTFPNVQAYQNAVVKSVAYAQQAQAALEAAGHAVNDGQGTREAFNAAAATFNQAVNELKALKDAGRPFNTGFWNFGGFKLDKFFKASGAQAVLDYRPPTLGAPGPTQPGPDAAFKLKLDAAKKAASDTVDPEPALLGLLKEATTEAQVDDILKVGRKGRRIAIGLDYWTECSSTFFAAAHARLAELKPQATFDAKLDGIKDAASDTVNPEAALIKLLAEAKTPQEVAKIRDAGAKGRRIGIDLSYWTECSTAFFAAVHQRYAQLNPPTTLEAKLDAISKAASDTVDPEPALIKLLSDAKNSAEIDQIMKVGRKGRRIGIDLSYWTEASPALFAAGHTRQLQLDLEALAKGVVPSDRVKFALQALPAFPDADSYRNYAVKAAAYALLDIQEVKTARAAFAAGTITKNQLQNAEDGLELSLKLVEALRKAPSAGFDARAFWDQYQIEATARTVLG